ncbi:MAG TPA: decarboxylating 6-phosphogluconate dehydrogenase [Terriglobia bacterium]|nr:decarboxylating 6-phosphogluconate dehydrogenase [Terriglobia bacterium]
MEIGMIGLGRMGAAMTKRLLAAGHTVVAYDQDRSAVDRSVADGAAGVVSLDAMVSRLTAPRTVWVMVPAGFAVNDTIERLTRLLKADDVLIDGGNSNYRETMQRAFSVQKSGVHFLDVGTSGGIWGLKEGYCLMIGGDADVVKRLQPVFEALAPSPDRGWAHVGPIGSGHYTKMVHNGIEYGLMQAYAEGFALLEKNKEFSFDLPKISEVWRHGSVVRSWLLDLTAEALAENPKLQGIGSDVADSGEGRWMVAEAIASEVPCPVITLSLLERIRSRVQDSFGNRVLAVMRNKFGGHDMTKR